MTDWTPLPDADDLGDELVLDDLALVGELTHPTRSALLHRLRTPHSAAELATALDVPVTRLYHHLNRLEELGLVKVVATRRSGSKTERRYRMAVRGFRVDPELARRNDPTAVADAVSAMFDVVKHEIRREFAIGALAPQSLSDRAGIALLGLSLRPEQHAAFIDRLQAVIAEFASIDEGNETDPDAQRVRVFIAGFPVSG